MPKAKVCIKEEKGRVAYVEMDIADPGPGQALIRTELTTICGSDLHILDEIDEIPAGMPMGHESIGVVEAIGSGVERLKVGDRIVAGCLTACGECVRCLEGEHEICLGHSSPLNILFGAQSEAFILNGADHSSTVIPASADGRAVLFASDIMSTGFGAAERGGVKPGSTVAIFAQGPVGLCATAGAKFLGAERIFTVDSLPERRALSKTLGATETFAPEEAVEAIMERTSGVGVDVAIEAVGFQTTLTACFNVTRLGGSVSSVGVYANAQTLQVPVDASFMHRSFITTICPSGPGRLAYLVDLCETGRVDLTSLLTHTMPIEDIAKAYDMFRGHSDGMIKPALKVS